MLHHEKALPFTVAHNRSKLSRYVTDWRWRLFIAIYLTQDTRASWLDGSRRCGEWSSLIGESCLWPCCHRVRSVASDLLRHQIWPMAFCRLVVDRHVFIHRLAVGRGHFIKPLCTGAAQRRYAWRSTTAEWLSLSPSSLANLLAYLRLDGRPGGDVIMTRRHASLTDDPRLQSATNTCSSHLSLHDDIATGSTYTYGRRPKIKRTWIKPAFHHGVIILLNKIFSQISS